MKAVLAFLLSVSVCGASVMQTPARQVAVRTNTITTLNQISDATNNAPSNTLQSYLEWLDNNIQTSTPLAYADWTNWLATNTVTAGSISTGVLTSATNTVRVNADSAYLGLSDWYAWLAASGAVSSVSGTVQSTTSFGFAGTNDFFAVPTNALYVECFVWGGGGAASNSYAPGGGGGYSRGSLQVSHLGGVGRIPTGSVLVVGVGAGGYVDKVTTNFGSGRCGGGGYSFVAVAGGATTNPVIAAGGGGGGGITQTGTSPGYGGGGGGLFGLAGRTFVASAGGGGGSQVGGGSGGVGSTASGSAGSGTLGGTGGIYSTTMSGGGGGGGYPFGGGGGGTDGAQATGGGGGGAGYIAGTLSATSVSGDTNGVPGGLTSAYYVAGVGSSAIGATTGGVGRVTLVVWGE